VADLIKSGLAEGADCCLPHWLHHSIGIQLLEGGIHVLIEKPIGITVKATKAIAAAAEKAGKVAAVAEQIRRFKPARAFRWAIAEKKIVGDVMTARAYQIMDGELPFSDPKFKWRGVKLLTGGGMIMDSGAHYADMMIHIFGEPDEIYCSTFNNDLRMIEDVPVFGTVQADVETQWHAIIRFKSGMEASWIYSRCYHSPMDKGARYYGTEGTIYDDKVVFHPFQMGGTVKLRSGTELSTEDVIGMYMETLSKDEKHLLFPYGAENAFGIQVWDFADAIRTGRKPEMDAMDGLRSKCLSETCFESGHARKAIKYDDVVSGKVCEFQRPIDEHWGL
jgi:UDP-N-acetyl-2-amino-2-deoxyglucuronate dehydrogenase